MAFEINSEIIYSQTHIVDTVKDENGNYIKVERRRPVEVVLSKLLCGDVDYAGLPLAEIKVLYEGKPAQDPASARRAIELYTEL